MELGHYLKKARESKRMSQQEVAELLGISQKTLSNMESGKTLPSVVVLVEMGKIYELDILKLLSENEIHLSLQPHHWASIGYSLPESFPIFHRFLLKK
jgi:transcriptional regulator with XRE-family HTH domain